MELMAEEANWVDMQEAAALNGRRMGLQLLIELPSFPHAVLYQQAAAGQQTGATAAPDAILPTSNGIILLHDPEVSPWQTYTLSITSHAVRSLAAHYVHPASHIGACVASGGAPPVV